MQSTSLSLVSLWPLGVAKGWILNSAGAVMGRPVNIVAIPAFGEESLSNASRARSMNFPDDVCQTTISRDDASKAKEA